MLFHTPLLFLLLAAGSGRAYDLNTTCSLPKALGGTGTCGPSFCSLIQSADPTCVFANSNASAPNYASVVAAQTCRVCTPSTDARCSAARLARLHGFPGSGVKAAYCNDNWLVLISSGEPGFTPNLLDVPNPPASTSIDGTRCVTRTTSMGTEFWRIYLGGTLLPTATRYNNVNSAAYPGGPGDAGYLSSPTNGVYGLPTRGAVGVSVSGQDIFPLFNNRAEGTLQACEVDSCNEHVGGGGGQPHLHGDPFGATCLYSAANYTNATTGAVDLAVHPPQIGYALDGFNIHGRYLATAAPGGDVPLDDCGGHDHDGIGYHYHAQVITSYTDAGCVVRSVAVGTAYPAFTPGVYQCFRGNLSAVPTWGINSTNPLLALATKPCCGATDYYTAPGIALSLTAASATPTPSPTRSMSRSATSAPATGSATASVSTPATATPTASALATATTTPPASSTATPSLSSTLTPSPSSVSGTASVSGTTPATASASTSATGTPSPSPSGTARATDSVSASATGTPSASSTETGTRTPSTSGSASTSGAPTPSSSAAASMTGSPSLSKSASGTPTGSAAATPTRSAAATLTRSATATLTRSATATLTRSATATLTRSAAATITRTATATPTRSAPATPTRTQTHTSTMTATRTSTKATTSRTRTHSPTVSTSATRTRKPKLM